jgi:hypothetical protein
MMRWVVVILGIVAIWSLGLLWIGTTHRDRCLRYGGSGCSLLPWSGSDMQPTSTTSSGGLFGNP